MTTTLQASQTALVKALNRNQANALVSYLNYKKYHWLTFGPLFRDLHLLFEEQGGEIFANLVRERTGGRINIKQYPGSSLVQGQQELQVLEAQPRQQALRVEVVHVPGGGVITRGLPSIQTYHYWKWACRSIVPPRRQATRRQDHGQTRLSGRQPDGCRASAGAGQ